MKMAASILALTAIVVASPTDPGVMQPIEPFAVLGWDQDGAIATFVWAVDEQGRLAEGITVRGERVRGSTAYWNDQEPVTLQRLLGFTDRQVLEGIVGSIDPDLIIEVLGIGGCAGDVNGDGRVDLRDLNLVLANMGKGCD